MSIYTPFPIETVTTWNEVLDRGIPSESMPVPLAPYFFIDGISARISTNCFLSLGTPKYLTRRYEFSDGGYEQTTYTTPRYSSFDRGGPVVTSSETSFSEASPKTGTVTTVYSDEVDFAENVATGLGEIEAYGIDWGIIPYGSGSGIFGGALMSGVITSRIRSGGIGDISWTRTRWRVPSNYQGTYFRMTWDYYLVPTTGDPSIIGSDEFLWNGPGNPDDEMDASWFSDYYYIDPPSDYGNVYLKNFKYWNLSASPYGIRPNQILMLIQPGETVMDMSKAANSMYQPLL